MQAGIKLFERPHIHQQKQIPEMFFTQQGPVQNLRRLQGTLIELQINCAEDRLTKHTVHGISDGRSRRKAVTQNVGGGLAAVFLGVFADHHHKQEDAHRIQLNIQVHGNVLGNFARHPVFQRVPRSQRITQLLNGVAVRRIPLMNRCLAAEVFGQNTGQKINAVVGNLQYSTVHGDGCNLIHHLSQKVLGNRDIRPIG